MSLGQMAPLGLWDSWGTFWAIVGVVVAVVFGVLAVWSAFRSNNPRRNLYITVDSSVSLLGSVPGLGNEIEVHRHGRTLAEPHVVTVDVVSRSARDIPRAAFDGKPLELDFRAPVGVLLEQKSHPWRAAVSAPPVAVAGTCLQVGPALLTSDHELRYTVLVDGEPDLDLRGSLTDVHIYTKPPRSRTIRTEWALMTATYVCFSGAGLLAALSEAKVVPPFGHSPVTNEAAPTGLSSATDMHSLWPSLTLTVLAMVFFGASLLVMDRGRLRWATPRGCR